MLQLFKLAHAYNAANGHECDKDDETVRATADAATHYERTSAASASAAAPLDGRSAARLGHAREQQRRVAAAAVVAKKSDERGGTDQVPEHVGRR